MSTLLLVGIASAVVVAAIVLLVSLGGSQRFDVDLVAAPDPSTVLDQVALAAGGAPRYTVTSRTESMITLNRRTTPWWAIAIAILLFPIGLVALVASRDDAATVLATPTADGTTLVQLRGRLTRKVATSIETALQARVVASA